MTLLPPDVAEELVREHRQNTVETMPDIAEYGESTVFSERATVEQVDLCASDTDAMRAVLKAAQTEIWPLIRSDKLLTRSWWRPNKSSPWFEVALARPETTASVSVRLKPLHGSELKIGEPVQQYYPPKMQRDLSQEVHALVEDEDGSLYLLGWQTPAGLRINYSEEEQ